MNIHLYLQWILKMRTRDEHKERAIREKALEMIVRDGFDGLSMQKLAKAASVSPATIYIYYKNREDLLNSLYTLVHTTFAQVALKDFHSELSLKDGLWIQWRNRMQFVMKYPHYFQFYEQFQNSPLITHQDVSKDEIRDTMCRFVQNAVKRGEMAKMDMEIFWCLAYGSFYSLVKFHLQRKIIMDRPFVVTDAKLRNMLEMVLKALKPR